MSVTALTVDELREELHQDGRDWWICRCGRPLADHSMRTIPNTGGREYVCWRLENGRFQPVTLPELDYTPEKGVHRP